MRATSASSASLVTGPAERNRSNSFNAATAASRIFPARSLCLVSNSLLALELIRVFVRLKSYEWLELATRSLVRKAPSVHLVFCEVQIDNRPLARLDDKVNADFSVSRRPSNDRVRPNGKRHLPGDYFISARNVIFNPLEEPPVNGIDGVGTVCVVSAIVEFITLRIDFEMSLW